MKKQYRVILTLLVLLSLLGCSSSTSQDSDPLVEAQGLQQDDSAIPVISRANRDNVIAEGIARPARSSQLSFEIPGKVVEIRVKTGDRVEVGAPLIRLNARELSLALRSAEQDVIAQEAALQELLNGASDKVISRADKGNADEVAQARVVLQVKQLQLKQAQAEDPGIGVAAAQARIKQLDLNLAQSRAQDPTPAVTTAEVSLERARIALSDTQNEYNKALDRPWEDQEIRDAWAKKLEQAQLDFKSAQAQLDNAQNTREAHTVGLGILAAQGEEARTQLAQALVAQKTYSTTLEILDADIEAARLRLESLETWDNPYRDEASNETVTQLRAALEKTRIGVEQLRLQIEDAEVSAPFAGTVVDVLVEAGDQIAPGQAVVVLATLDQLEIHTTDLTELDIAGVTVGQPAQITVDALPGRELAGTVAEIALQSQDYRGDVVYQVTIKLDEPRSAITGLRWGMTTMVEIRVG